MVTSIQLFSMKLLISLAKVIFRKTAKGCGRKVFLLHQKGYNILENIKFYNISKSGLAFWCNVRKLFGHLYFEYFIWMMTREKFVVPAQFIALF